MKSYKLISIALFAGLMFLSASCVKEVTPGDALGLEGTPIVFSAASTFNNGIETRAEYSGDLIGTSSKTERIEWRANDPIKIFYGSSSDNYTVSANGSQDGKDSYASVSGGSLAWASGTPHVFYAWYPNNSNGSITNANHVSGTIPATQSVNTANTITVDGVTKYQPNTKDYGFMFGYLSLAESSESVVIPFRPAFTTFEFKLKRKSGDADKKIRTIQVSTADGDGSNAGTNLTGTFAFDIPNNGGEPTLPASISTSGTLGKTITLDFSGFTSGGVSVPTDSFLDFSVLALPINQKYVKVVFTYTDNTVKKLSLKDASGNWYEFTGGKKYIITNDNVPGGDVWEYVLVAENDITVYGHGTESDLPFTIKSYKYKTSDPTNLIPVSWTAAVTAATGEEATTSNLTIGTTSGSGSATPAGNTTNITEASTAAVVGGGAPGDAAAAKMALNPVKGSASSRYDLSLYDVHGNAHNRETANCYVINSPGFYKFPLVYGNAIKGGSTNTNAFAPSKAANSNTYLTPFKRSDNSGITGPYILTNMGLSASQVEAAIVWQDVDENETSLILKENTTDFTSYGIDVSDQGYIWFNIEKENIKQGNVVIAVRKKSDHSILWSWHLWFTEKDLTPVPTKTHPQRGSNTVGFMPYNLGWTDRSNATTTAYPTRKWTVTVTQAESGNTDEVIVKQIGEVTYIAPNFGTCTFYEFGRKDPELPFRDRNNNKKYTAGFTGNGTNRYLLVDPGETVTLHVINSGTGMDVATGIKNPQAHIFNGTTTCWIGNSDASTPLNLWSANITQNAQDTPTVKTVYDPCPPGFCVPRLWAFSNFANTTSAPGNTTYPVNGIRMPADIGFNFPTGYSNPDRVFFPASGSRAHDNAGPQYLDEWGNFWTAAAVEFGGPYTHGKTLNFRFILNEEPTINVQFDRWKSCAYTVRPAVEETSVNISSGGMEGHDYNFNDGWQIN